MSASSLDKAFRDKRFRFRLRQKCSKSAIGLFDKLVVTYVVVVLLVGSGLVRRLVGGLVVGGRRVGRGMVGFDGHSDGQEASGSDELVEEENTTETLQHKRGQL